MRSRCADGSKEERSNVEGSGECSVIAAFVSIPVLIVRALVAFVIIPAGSSSLARIASISVPELILLAMLAAAIIPVILGACMAFVVPPVCRIAGLATPIMPSILSTSMTFSSPPVSVVACHAISVSILFLTLCALVAAPVIPMIIVAAGLRVCVPVLIARALVALASPVMCGITALVTIPMFIVFAVIALPIVPTIRSTPDMVSMLVMVVAHTVATGLERGSRVDDGRQDGESGNNLRDKHIERMFSL